MQMQYPTLQNAALDTEDEDHQIIPGAWRDVGLMHELKKIKGVTRVDTAGKQQQKYLKHYFNSLAGSVPWQKNMI